MDKKMHTKACHCEYSEYWNHKRVLEVTGEKNGIIYKE